MEKKKILTSKHFQYDSLLLEFVNFKQKIPKDDIVAITSAEKFIEGFVLFYYKEVDE